MEEQLISKAIKAFLEYEKDKNIILTLLRDELKEHGYIATFKRERGDIKSQVTETSYTTSISYKDIIIVNNQEFPLFMDYEKTLSNIIDSVDKKVFVAPKAEPLNFGI